MSEMKPMTEVYTLTKDTPSVALETETKANLMVSEITLTLGENTTSFRFDDSETTLEPTEVDENTVNFTVEALPVGDDYVNVSVDVMQDLDAKTITITPSFQKLIEESDPVDVELDDYAFALYNVD